MLKRLRGMQKEHDKLIMASVYGEAGAPHLAKELFKDQKRIRPRVRKRPRMELRAPR
jgi:hypothetical protein